MSISDSTSSNDLVCLFPGCKSSGKAFKRSYELERHKLIHFPSKKLVCPIQGCKHKKKGKSFTRDDKFREHITAHGELALFLCPVPHCKTVQVKNGDFASHIADDHNINERCEILSFLKILRIDSYKGRWACPNLCDVTATNQFDLVRHSQKHDLVERVNFMSLFDSSVNFPLTIGRATCPICTLEVCSEDDYIKKLYSHLENTHATDLVLYGDEVAKLLSPGWRWYYDEEFPKLAQILRDCKPTQASPPAFPPNASWPSSAESSSRSSEPPNDLKNFLSGSSFDGDADSTDPPSSRAGEIPTQLVWTPHHNDFQNSIFLPEIGVPGRSMPMGNLSISGPDMISQQGLAPMPNILPLYGLNPQQNYLDPHLQPQGYMVPQSCMTVEAPQNIPVADIAIPPLMPQVTHAWNLSTNNPINMGFGQSGYGGHMQWPLQTQMSYGYVNQQQDMALYLPFPEHMPYSADTWPDTHSGESSNNGTN